MPKLPFTAIPAPIADVNALMRSVEALRIAVETLTRQRGDERSWPITVSELRRLGILDANAQLPDAPDR